MQPARDDSELLSARQHIEMNVHTGEESEHERDERQPESSHPSGRA
jgi:hypothetical protein